MILTENTLRKLQRLRLVAPRIRPGLMRGDRRSSRRGSSIEFADFRSYVPGDDLRRVDWNVYARLDRPYLKLLEEEEDLAVYVLIDGSASMDWGVGPANKFLVARQLAAALVAIALSGGDRAYLGVLKGSRVDRDWGPSRSAATLPRALTFLQALAPNGPTDLNGTLHSFLRTPRRPGLVVLISDLFSPDGFSKGVQRLQRQGHDLDVIHLLAPEEMNPPLSGELRLVDVETGQPREVSITPGLLDLYEKHLSEWTGQLQQNCRRRGIRYVQCPSAVPWDRFVLYNLRQAGFLR